MYSHQSEVRKGCVLQKNTLTGHMAAVNIKPLTFWLQASLCHHRPPYSSNTEHCSAGSSSSVREEWWSERKHSVSDRGQLECSR